MVIPQLVSCLCPQQFGNLVFLLMVNFIINKKKAVHEDILTTSLHNKTKNRHLFKNMHQKNIANTKEHPETHASAEALDRKIHFLPTHHNLV